LLDILKYMDSHAAIAASGSRTEEINAMSQHANQNAGRGGTR